MYNDESCSLHWGRIHFCKHIFLNQRNLPVYVFSNLKILIKVLYEHGIKVIVIEVVLLRIINVYTK